MLQTGSIIAPGVQIYKSEAVQMSSFQDMTYYDPMIGICLNFFLSKVKLLFEVNYFSDNQIVIVNLNLLLSKKNHRVSILVTQKVYHSNNDNDDDNNNDIVTSITQLKTFSCAKNIGSPERKSYKQEFKAIKDLKNDWDTIIKPAEKLVP